MPENESPMGETKRWACLRIGFDVMEDSLCSSAEQDFLCGCGLAPSLLSGPLHGCPCAHHSPQTDEKKIEYGGKQQPKRIERSVRVHTSALCNAASMQRGSS